MTAVEFIVKEISEILGPLKTEGMTDLLLQDAYKKAKDFEWEQLKYAYDAGIWDVGCKAPNFDEYYKRTFKQE